MFGTRGLWTGRVRRAGARGVRRLAFGLLRRVCSSRSARLRPPRPRLKARRLLRARLPDLGSRRRRLSRPPERAHESSTYDQGLLYDALTPLQGNVTAADLENYYLSEKFGVTGPVIGEENLGPGLVIKRDKNNIPHIYGATREQVMFGSGWVAAKDRGLLLKLAVGPSFAATLDIPGINPFGLLLKGAHSPRPNKPINFVNAQKSVLLEKGAKGVQVLSDLEYWAAGVNAFEEAFKPYLPPQLQVPHLTATNAIAGFALIGSIFGNGGGNEVTNSNFLAKLKAKLGPKQGPKVFRDLREVNDPEAPTTTTKPFPYDGVPSGPTPGAAVIDPGSMSASAAQAASVAQASKRKASNFLLAGPEHSADGHPLAVMGPQLGYFYPEIVMQADLHGGGVDAQGDRRPDLALRVHRAGEGLRLEPHERGQREHAAVPREAVQPRQHARPRANPPTTSTTANASR